MGWEQCFSRRGRTGGRDILILWQKPLIRLSRIIQQVSRDVCHDQVEIFILCSLRVYTIISIGEEGVWGGEKRGEEFGQLVGAI